VIPGEVRAWAAAVKALDLRNDAGLICAVVKAVTMLEIRRRIP
jgi:hypothetical protein